MHCICSQMWPGVRQGTSIYSLCHHWVLLHHMCANPDQSDWWKWVTNNCETVTVFQIWFYIMWSRSLFKTTMTPLSGAIFHLTAGSLMVNFWRDVWADPAFECGGNGITLGTFLLLQCILMLIDTGLHAKIMAESEQFKKPKNAVKLLQLVSGGCIFEDSLRGW